MNLTHVTIVGNLTADPKLNPANGEKRAFCRLSVAVNERRGEEEITNFYDVSTFGDLAESVATSLTKGLRVIVYGHLNTYKEPYTTDDGRETHRTRIGITASAIGPDLFRQFARVAKVASTNGSKPAPSAAPAAEEAQPVAAAVAAPASVSEEDF